MTIDEGGVPKGNLSEYITRREAEIAKQIVTPQQHLDQFILKTASLRDYLIRLAAPLDEFLGDLKAKQMLEEARDKCWPGSVIATLAPTVYREIVLKPNPDCKSFELYGNEVQEEDYDSKKVLQIENDFGVIRDFLGSRGDIDLEDLLQPDTFQKLIPELRGYGIRLDSRVGYMAPEKISRYVEGSSSYLSAIYGDSTRSGGSVRYVATGRNIRVVDNRIISLEVVKARQGNSYDIMYSLYHYEDGGQESGYLTPHTRILSKDLPDGLMKVIGDDVIAYKC